MSNLEKAAVAFLSVVAIGMIGGFLWLYQASWQKPLGPTLQISTVTPYMIQSTVTSTYDVTSSLDSNNPDRLTSQPPLASVNQIVSSSETPTPTTGACGAPPVMNILAVGSDSRGDSYLYGLADVIRLVRIDTVIPKITVLEIPRDLWVQIPDIADNLNGQDHEKLNQAYLYGNPGFGYTDDPARGPGLLARTLTLNFGTQIDHYTAMNMRTFEKVIDAVGGVDVNLSNTVDGRTATDTNTRLLFPKGENHLNGTQALTLARIRIEGTFARANNQNIVLCALRKKLTSPAVVTKIPDLIKSFQGAIQTDLSPEQISQLACVGTQLQPQNIIFTTFPEDLFTQDRIYDPVFKKSVFVWNVDYDILREYVERFNAGTWPAPVVFVEPSKKAGTSICQ